MNMAQVLGEVGPAAYALAKRRGRRTPSRPVPRCVVGARVVRGLAMGGWDLEMTELHGKAVPVYDRRGRVVERFNGYLKTFEVDKARHLLDAEVVIVDGGQCYPGRVVGVSVDQAAGALARAEVEVR